MQDTPGNSASMSLSLETLMSAEDAIDLVQDITTDCSVVASLCACTSRALKGHGKVRVLTKVFLFC